MDLQKAVVHHAAVVHRVEADLDEMAGHPYFEDHQEDEIDLAPVVGLDLVLLQLLVFVLLVVPLLVLVVVFDWGRHHVF